MGNGITDFMGEHKKTEVTSGGVIASITLAKIGVKVGEEVAGKAAVTIVQPAIWAITQHKPDGADVALWGLGTAALWAGETALGYVTAGAKLVKAAVDDGNQKLLAQARASEPAEYRKGIRACIKYESFAAPDEIEATIVASHGGTAWLHRNGLWVYIQDARGSLVCDYKSMIAQTVYQPVLPLHPVGGGKYRWHALWG